MQVDSLTCSITVTKQEVPRNKPVDGSVLDSFVEKSGKASIIVVRTCALYDKVWIGYIRRVAISANSNSVLA